MAALHHMQTIREGIEASPVQAITRSLLECCVNEV